MNIAQILKSFIFLTAMTMVLSSCYSDDDWLDDNAESLGNYPVISTFTAPDGTVVESGDVVTLDLRYFSTDPIASITFYEKYNDEVNEVFTTGYEQNFDPESQTDKLIYEYTVPEFPVEVDQFTIEVVIVNENSLERSSSIDFEVL